MTEYAKKIGLDNSRFIGEIMIKEQMFKKRTLYETMKHILLIQ